MLNSTRAEHDSKFIETCLELKFIQETDADRLREFIGDEDSGVSLAAVRRGFLSAAEVDIVYCLQRPTEIVPGYKLLNLVGRGGMGAVYRALQIDLERMVALKIILTSNVTQPNVAERFEREAKALARLQHPNIVQALNFGKHDGRYFFAMEFVPGPTCEQVVRDNGIMSPAQAWPIARQVASGLLHAMNQNLVHRDIKPANLLLLPPPEGSATKADIVKIADFGLAMFSDQSADQLRLTTGEKVMGSPAYMSPEQFGGRQVDFRCDLYALGATVWHLLFGKPPHQGKSIASLYQQKAEPMVIDPSSLPVQLPENQLRLLVRLLSPNPNERPQSYPQLIAMIDALGIVDPAQATTVSTAVKSTARPDEVAESTGAVAVSEQPTIESPIANLPADELTQTIEVPAATGADRRPKMKWILVATALFVTALVVISSSITRKPRGERTHTRTISSTPLFDGVTLSGWDVGGSMVGAWNTVEAPDASTAITCTSERGAMTRRFAETPHARISLFVWIQQGSGPVDVDFSIDTKSPAARRGCVRFTGESIQLCEKATDFGDVTVLQSTELDPSVYQRFHVIDIEKQSTDWFVFFEQRFVGSIPIERIGSGSAIRLVVHGSNEIRSNETEVYFADVQLSELGPKQP